MEERPRVWFGLRRHTAKRNKKKVMYLCWGDRAPRQPAQEGGHLDLKRETETTTPVPTQNKKQTKKRDITYFREDSISNNSAGTFASVVIN